MSSAPPWIPLDERQLDEFVTSSNAGVQTRLAPSPYDVPEAISVETDAARNTIMLRFRYLEPERTDAVKIRAGLAFHVGHRTKRLYAIEMQVTNVRKIDAIRKAIYEASQAVLHYVPGDRRVNFKLARKAVENSADELAKVATAE
jgi:hypothetical protein